MVDSATKTALAIRRRQRHSGSEGCYGSGRRSSYPALAVLGYVPGGQVLPAILVSGVFITFLVITYAMLISVMPRAGGDYVWQSRVLGGGISFLLAVTGWWFILWYWAPVYANILNVELFQPLAAVLK